MNIWRIIYCGINIGNILLPILAWKVWELLSIHEIANNICWLNLILMMKEKVILNQCYNRIWFHQTRCILCFFVQITDLFGTNFWILKKSMQKPCYWWFIPLGETTITKLMHRLSTAFVWRARECTIVRLFQLCIRNNSADNQHIHAYDIRMPPTATDSVLATTMPRTTDRDLTSNKRSRKKNMLYYCEHTLIF